MWYKYAIAVCMAWLLIVVAKQCEQEQIGVPVIHMGAHHAK
jgi:hypothetical protein